jgi:O-antigen/teichoic acid export membrane protein
MISKIFNTFSIKFFSAIFNLLIAIVVSQYLGAAGKGIQSIILTTISFVLIFENIAGGAVLVYLSSRYKTSILIILSYFWSIFTGIVFYFILSNLNIVNQDFIFSICLLSVINSFASNNSNILLGKEKINFSNIVSFIQPIFTLITLLIFLFIFRIKSINIYINSLYIAYIFSFLLSIFYLKHAKDKTNKIKINNWKQTAKAMFSLGFYNQLSHITSLLNMRLSYYLLDKYQGAEALGIYSNGVSLTEAIWMVSGSMAMVQYSKISNTSDRKYAQELTVNMVKISLLLTIVILIPMLLLPSGFYIFIFGKDFANVNLIMNCLAPGVIFYNFALLIGHYFSGTGKYYINTTASAIGLIITLLLSFYTIPIWGFYGAGVVTSISYITISATVLFFFQKESKISFMLMIPTFQDIKQYFSSIKTVVNNKKNYHE